MKAALRALLPGGVVLLIAGGLLFLAPDRTVEDIASRYGLVVYGGGLALSWVFHRSRAFIALSMLAWVDIAVVGEPDSGGLVLALGTVVLALVGVLGLMRDRGVASPVGSIQVLGVSSIAALAGLFFADPERVATFAARPELAGLGSTVWMGFPRLTVVVAAFTVIAVVYGFHRYRGPVERAFVWSVIMLLTAMHPEIGENGAALFLLGTALTIGLSVVETSYVMAYRDELTGLPGRRALMQYLDGLKGTYTLAMVDVDHFKQFNDRHGHDVGDQVLHLVAARLAKAKGGGKAFRYGGEEFTLVFPGRTVSEARSFLDEVRESICDSKFVVRSWKRPRKKPKKGSRSWRRSAARASTKNLAVEVSIGAADSSVDSDPAVILKKADRALYRAKKGGRNRVSVVGARRRPRGSAPATS